MAGTKSRDAVSYLGSADDASVVTPSDTTVIACRGLWVGTGGDLAVTFSVSGETITLANVPDGSLLPIAVYRVMAATTASDIVALY